MATRGEHRLRNTLVVAQVALAFRDARRCWTRREEPAGAESNRRGIEVRNVLTAQLTLNFTKYNSGQLGAILASATARSA